MQPAYKVVQIQGMSAYSVRSPGPDSCVSIGIGIGIGESRLYNVSGYRGGPEPFHISELHCIFYINLHAVHKTHQLLHVLVLAFYLGKLQFNRPHIAHLTDFI